MADTEQEAQWCKAFEMIGPETLRLRLEHRRNEYHGEYGRAAEVWLLEKDAEATALDRKRFRKILGWAITAGVAGILGAIAAWVAAWPIMKEWFR